MNKTYTFYIPITFFAVNLLLSLPVTKSFISEFNWWQQLLFLGIIIPIYSLSIWAATKNDLKQYERFLNNRSFLLDDKVKSLIRNYKRLGIELRVNVMMVQNIFFNKYFKIVWYSDTMNHHPDINLKLT